MPSISKIASTLSPAEWAKKVGAADKAIGVATQMKELATQHAELLKQELGTAGLSTAEEVQARIDEIEGDFAKTAEAVAKKAKGIADAIKKNDAALKKAGGDAAKAAAAAAAAAADVASEVGKAGTSAVSALKTLLAKFEAQEKKDAAAAKGKEKDKESDDEESASLPGHNSKVKSMMNKLKSGSMPPTLFAFAQNNVKVPYSKGKDWGEKSLMAVGPRAGKSFRTQFVKLLNTDKFKFFFGEIRFETEGKDKGKFILMFESPLPNSKQLKDALLYQCGGSSPKFQMRKNTGEVVDEAGEGEEEQAEESAEEIAAKGSDPFKSRIDSLKKAIAAARGPVAAQAKAAFDKAVEFAGKGDAAKAKPLIEWAEAQLKAAGAAPAGATSESAAQTAQAPAANGALRTAREGWSTARTAAVKGIKDLAEQIRREYGGEAEQKDAMDKAVSRLNALADQLSDALEKQIDDTINGRSSVSAAKQALTKVIDVVTKDDVMKTIDGNELIPSMTIVAPMRQSLASVARALG